MDSGTQGAPPTYPTVRVATSMTVQPAVQQQSSLTPLQQSRVTPGSPSLQQNHVAPGSPSLQGPVTPGLVRPQSPPSHQLVWVPPGQAATAQWKRPSKPDGGPEWEQAAPLPAQLPPPASAPTPQGQTYVPQYRPASGSTSIQAGGNPPNACSDLSASQRMIPSANHFVAPVHACNPSASCSTANPVATPVATCSTAPERLQKRGRLCHRPHQKSMPCSSGRVEDALLPSPLHTTGHNESTKSLPSQPDLTFDQYLNMDSSLQEDDPGATPSLGTSKSEPVLETWCRSMGLGDAVLTRLHTEKFKCPEHLVHLEKDELAMLVTGLKLGEKGGFYHAVHLLKEQQSQTGGCWTD